MRQNVKRFYGTLAFVAFISGMTGAFAVSAVSKATHADAATSESGNETTTNIDTNLLSLSSTTSTPTQPIDLTMAAEKGCNAVVYIKVVMGGQTRTIEYRDPFEDFFSDFFGHGGGGTQRRQVQTPKREAAGSGVIISSDGYIVTNNHVVQDANEITITLNDSREFSARIVGLDADTDLALLKIDSENLPAITIGNSDTLKVGEWVLAVGNPFNLTSTVTAGIVSAKARNLGANRTGIESFIQTDAAINQGNSGGALINARGELVGINAMLYSQTGSFSGYGFAIPVSIMTKVVSDLKEYGTVQRALLGISGMTLHDYINQQKSNDSKYNADFGTIEGVYVAEVLEEGAAYDAGIKEGDVIVSLGNKKITKMSELQEATTKFRPGDKCNVTVMRDKKEKTLSVTFRNAKGNTAIVKTLNMDILGAEFKELTEDKKKSLNVSSGIQITSLSAGKLREAGMAKDFIIRKVNGQNIKSVKDFEQVFKAAQNSEDRTLFIWGQNPSGKTQSFAIQLDDED